MRCLWVVADDVSLQVRRRQCVVLCTVYDRLGRLSLQIESNHEFVATCVNITGAVCPPECEHYLGVVAGAHSGMNAIWV